MTPLRWISFVAWRELAFAKEGLTMTCTRSKHQLDAILLDRGTVDSRIIFLLKLYQTVSSSGKIVEEFKFIHAKLLSESEAISGAPMRHINLRNDHVVFYFPCNSNYANLGPVLRTSLEFLRKLN